MQQVIDLKLEFRDDDFLPAELILQLDQLVFKLDPQLPLVVQVVFELLLRLLKLPPLVFQHELDLPKVVIVSVCRVYFQIILLREGPPKC